jgi:hypothetical protein
MGSRPGLEAGERQGSKFLGPGRLLVGRPALDQPAVEDQQVSRTAFPTRIVLTARYAVHPGFAADSGKGLFTNGALAGHDITMKNISVRLRMSGVFGSGSPAKKK